MFNTSPSINQDLLGTLKRPLYLFLTPQPAENSDHIVPAENHMPLSYRDCHQCNKQTRRLAILFRIYRAGERRWEDAFSLCTACLQLNRYALNNITKSVYTAVPGSDRRTDLGIVEREVIAYLSSQPVDIPGRKQGAIQRHLITRGIRLNDHEMETLLERMEFAGLITSTRVDWTKHVIERIAKSTRKGIKSERCVRCGATTMSLYAQMRDNPTGKETKKVIGSYCIKCGWYSLRSDVLRRFIM
jgi:hypothetical protein